MKVLLEMMPLHTVGKYLMRRGLFQLCDTLEDWIKSFLLGNNYFTLDIVARQQKYVYFYKHANSFLILSQLFFGVYSVLFFHFYFFKLPHAFQG